MPAPMAGADVAMGGGVVIAMHLLGTLGKEVHADHWGVASRRRRQQEHDRICAHRSIIASLEAFWARLDSTGRACCCAPHPDPRVENTLPQSQYSPFSQYIGKASARHTLSSISIGLVEG